MNILSLFDGMSCGRIALEKAGVKIDNYYASEIKPHAIKVSKHNYPDIIQVGDVTKLDGGYFNKIDLLIGVLLANHFQMLTNMYLRVLMDLMVNQNYFLNMLDY